ncbi:MAG TPA: hypothetical protein VMY42_18825 [Thermoguttaceae bacterium]|nr:hypothetical protein [Thermoguttaceae bacterium]
MRPADCADCECGGRGGSGRRERESTAAATVVMLALYAWWIPRFGAMGAARATLVGLLFTPARLGGACNASFTYNTRQDDWQRCSARPTRRQAESDVNLP